MVVNLDDNDLKILIQLDKDGELNVDELSKELGISSSTIYYRLETFRENGIIKGKTTELDPTLLGFDLTAITSIKVSYDKDHDIIAKELIEISGVQRVFSMLGESSFFVISRVRDHDHLQNLVESIVNIDGVQNSTTNVVLRKYKDENRLLINYEKDDLKEILND